MGGMGDQRMLTVKNSCKRTGLKFPLPPTLVIATPVYISVISCLDCCSSLLTQWFSTLARCLNPMMEIF